MRSLVLLLALAAAPCAAQQTPADSARVYELNEVEVLPRPQNVADFTAALQAGYPPQLSQAGVGGTVQVSFVVRPDGSAGDARVVSTPDPAFDAPTLQAVALLRFSPAQVQGRPVAVRVQQPISWQAPPPAATATEKAVNGYELEDVDELPQLRNRNDFGRALARLYPAPLRDAGMQGMVRVRFRVETDGTTSNATITRSTNREFDAPTLEAIGGMRFSPARLNGQPVRVWVEQPIEWSVRGTPLTSPNRPPTSALPPPRVCGTYEQC